MWVKVGTTGGKNVLGQMGAMEMAAIFLGGPIFMQIPKNNTHCYNIQNMLHVL